MNCKFCNGELPEDGTVCPICGKDNAEEETVITEEAVYTEEIAPEGEVSEDVTSEEEAPAGEETTEEPSQEEPPAPKNTALKITLCVITVLAVLGAIAAGIWYGVNGGWKPRPNDVTCTDIYTDEDQKVLNRADKVVAVVGDVELTNGELQLYYWEAVNMFLNDYYYYLSYIGLDYTKPLAEQTCYFDESLTWEQYFLEYSLDNWHRYAAVSILAEEANHVPSENIQAYLDELPQNIAQMATSYGFKSVAEMLNDSYGAGATEENYLSYAKNYYICNDYLDTVYLTLIPTQEEIDAYYAEHEADVTAAGFTRDMGLIADVRHILIMPEGGTTDPDTGRTTYSEEEMAAAKEEAERVYNEWLSGAATEESFIELVTAYSKDTGSVPGGGLISGVCADGTYVENFQNWSVDPARKSGDTGIVESPFGYHIMYFVEGEDYCNLYLESTIANERMTEIIEHAMLQNPMDVSYRKIVLGAVDFTN